MPRGRKKKIQEVKIEETPTIAYDGQVTVSLIKNHKKKITRKYHNNGAKPLFDFLINCLSGTFKTNLIPKYVGLIKKEGGLASTILTEVSKKEPKLSNSSIIYRILVSTSQLENKNVQISGFALYNEDAKSNLSDAKDISGYSMLVMFGKDDYYDLNDVDSILITWQLQLLDVSSIKSK